MTKTGCLVALLITQTMAFGAIRVNAGGPAYADPGGQQWSADTGWTGGSAYSNGSAVANTNTPFLYQTVRYGSSFSYQFGTTNGNYLVRLKFAENYYTAAGKRMFNVAINGASVLQNFDIVAASGGRMVAVDKSFTVSVTNSKLAIAFSRGSADLPLVSAIEILPQATVTVSVAPASVNLYGSQTAQFTTQVNGSDNTAVAWSISPSNAGTISSAGLYTAPASIAAAQTVTVKATSAANSAVSASAVVSLLPPVTMSLAPTGATVMAGQSQQFAATVASPVSTAVTWSLTPATGTLTSTGLYTASGTVSSTQTVTVTATSVADPRVSTTAAVSVRPTPVSQQIRTEATLPNDAANRPLPLVGSWNASTQWAVGTASDGFSPAYQMQLLDQDHHILPWFNIPEPGFVPGATEWINYYQAAITKAASLNLPICFVGTQWERLLYDDPAYFGLPAAQNPNVVTTSGAIQNLLSPFGPITPWSQVGAKWASSWFMQKLQEWYPNPPLVIFVSNNEGNRLKWTDVEQDSRYLSLYGTGRDANFKRAVVGDGWTARDRALQQAWRDALVSAAWKSNSIFVGYNAFGPSWFSRWSSWKDYSLYSPSRIDPNPLTWDGTSSEHYLYPGDGITDFTVFSPQIESMNWIFMQDEAKLLNPKFWFEFAPWDGSAPSWPDDMPRYFARLGQTYTPARYGGMVQFSLWLLRPRVVREYRNYTDTRAAYEPYFLSIVSAVDRVYNNPVLTAFWRSGALVPNRRFAHPYQNDLPTEYAGKDRWFLLDTSLDPARPWALSTQLPVYSEALVTGTAPNRQWLVYAHSPLADRSGVGITIPDYGQITVGVTVGGSFYVVDESARTVTPVLP